jgi:hypothetical protein
MISFCFLELDLCNYDNLELVIGHWALVISHWSFVIGDYIFAGFQYSIFNMQSSILDSVDEEYLANALIHIHPSNNAREEFRSRQHFYFGRLIFKRNRIADDQLGDL